MRLIARVRFVPFAAFLGLLLASPLAAVPRLVQDLRQGLVDEAGPMSFAGFQDGILYFSFADSAHGRELWRTDGKADGTWRLTDVCPGPCDSTPEHLVALGGSLYFRASDGVSGNELWRSDGLPGSERQVRDLCPGPCGSQVIPAVFGGRMLFVAAGDESQWLWRSDGTPQGTVRVREICSSCTGPVSELQRVGDRLVFGLSDEKGPELWRTDGTPEGTQRLRKLAPGAEWWDYPSPFSAGDFAFFWTRGALWRTDGTPGGTVRLATPAELECSQCTSVQESVLWNGALYSILDEGQLVRSDGTRAGTRILDRFGDRDSIQSLTPVGEWLLYLAGFEGYPHQVWRTKGSFETTQRIAEPPANDILTAIIPWGEDKALIPYTDDSGAVRLWMTDGTSEGSRTLEGVPSGGLLTGGGRLYVASVEQHAILRFDGPEAAPVPVHDLRTEASAGPLAQTVLGGKLLFSARVSEVRAPLFVSDGTSAGTGQISGQADQAGSFTRVGSRISFAARTPRPFDSAWLIERDSLWSTDGTPGGTVKAALRIFGFTSVGELGRKLLFAADREREGRGLLDIELWRSDGTSRGTAVVKNINPFQTDYGIDGFSSCQDDPSSPGPGVAVGGRLLFAADDGRAGRELWSSDGTPAGTRLLLDINTRVIPAPPSPDDCPEPSRNQIGRGSDPRSFLAFRGGALFAAHDTAAGRELWWSDGTRAGTRRVQDLRPGISSSNPRELIPFNGAVYFLATRATGGDGLWRTDGTPRGTFLVHDLTLAGKPSWGKSLTVAGGRLFFSVLNETTGAELWSTRGTRATTALVTDLRPGPASSSPQALADAGGVLVFAADDGVTGLEPWSSDGTAAGTRQLEDLWPGREPSAPGPFSRVGNVLLTGANDGEHGRELWAIPVEDL